MVTLVKHEWHQVDSQFTVEIDEDLLSEIYPDMDEDEIKQLLVDLENGDADIDELINDAWNNDVEIGWERQYDDWWTDRKGGYEITYELGDESSWHHEPEPDPPTHKCTNCKYEGGPYDGKWRYEDKDGNELDEAVQECPYCESDLMLTEFGKQKEIKDKAHMEEIERMINELQDDYE
jgi:hypothetical protein